jgi:putative membrane protein
MTVQPVLAQWMHYGWNAWWMWLWMALFWAIVIAIAIAVSRAATRRDDGTRRAQDVLAERYARGEIDTDEYQTRSRELEKAAQ